MSFKNIMSNNIIRLFPDNIMSFLSAYICFVVLLNDVHDADSIWLYMGVSSPIFFLTLVT